ncbi:MAG: hypothetical protein WD688_26190, partial [Candidatus Binatia bacterium]
QTNESHPMDHDSDSSGHTTGKDSTLIERPRTAQQDFRGEVRIHQRKNAQQIVQILRRYKFKN